MLKVIRFLVALLVISCPGMLSAEAPLDFDGDGRSDRTIFRSSTGTWWIERSTSGLLVAPFGLAGDTPVPADYDGDGKTDLAIWRSGVFWIQRSFSGLAVLPWGTTGDDPRVVADYDGDGKADPAIYRPSTGTYWIRRSLDSATVVAEWGVSTDLPLPGNFVGSSRADYCVYRPGDNTFYVMDGQTSAITTFTFGDSTTDRIVAMNRIGNSLIDFAVFRNSGPETGNWYSEAPIGPSVASQFEPLFGTTGDMPLPFVETAGGHSSLALVRDVGPSLIWYRRQTPDGPFSQSAWGLDTDIVPGYTMFTRTAP